MVAAAFWHTRLHARPPLRRLRHPVQLSEGSTLTTMKCASAIFQKRRIWHVIVQPKVRSSRVASVVRFINIRLASRAHQ